MSRHIRFSSLSELAAPDLAHMRNEDVCLQQILGALRRGSHGF
jgi:hypothetical protein